MKTKKKARRKIEQTKKTGNIQVAGEVPGFEYGICPIMTSSQVMTVGRANSHIVSAPGEVTQAMAQVTNYVPCAGDKCQLWNSGRSCCAMWLMSELVDSIYKVTEPARGGDGG